MIVSVCLLLIHENKQRIKHNNLIFIINAKCFVQRLVIRR